MIGQTISHYRILSRLGEGGMGVVYLAEDLTLRRQVALKFLPVDVAADAEARGRLIHEAQAAAALLHPHICPIYEVAESDGHAFLAMAYLQGQTLRERLREGPLPLDDALTIARQIGGALTAAHAKGVIHRDVKPANVMLTASGAMLTDFGLAVVSGTSRLTRTGSTVGTAAYLSPEQIRGADADERADVWALGVLLYEMVSGQLPFGGEHEQALFYAILSAEPAALATPARSLPAGLDGILAKALAKERGKRYQKVADLVTDLEALAQDRAALPAGRVKKKRPQWLMPAAATATAVVLFATLIFLNVASLRDRLFAGGPRIRSIAVLPLANLSGDPNQEYFADGMTEALINDLGQVSSLRVISRTTAMQYKGAKKSLAQIVRELRVDAVVEGSVQRSGERLRISVQLIRARGERQLWADAFERDLRDVLALQGEISSTIAGAVSAKLTPGDRARLARARPVDPEAYQAYLMGRSLGVYNAKAIDYYERAIAADSTFAPAYVGLADVYGGLVTLGDLPAREALRKQRAAAQKAVDLDKESGDAHRALADALSGDWQWAAAEREYRRALELNPNSGSLRGAYGFFLLWLGRYDEAAAESERAQELTVDPPTSESLCNAAFGFYYARRFDRALSLLQMARELDPQSGRVAFVHAFPLVEKGRYEEAYAEAKRAFASSPGVEPGVSGCGYIFGRLGKRADADKALGRLREMARREYVDPYSFAWVWGGIGDVDSTMAWLERAYAEHSVGFVKFEIWPAALRADPRFRDLLKRLGLPPD